MKNPHILNTTPAPGAKPGRTSRRLSLALLTALLLSACASLPGETPQEQVRQRATERWQALLAYDYARAYEFATPSYRALVSPQSYRSRQGVALQRTSAKVVRVDCPEPEKCMARVEVSVKPPLGKNHGAEIVAPVDETWLLQNGQWWLVERL
jgi:hypothetical protein